MHAIPAIPPSTHSALTDLIFTVLASEVNGTGAGAGAIVCLIATARASIQAEAGCWREGNRHDHCRRKP